MYTMMPRLEHCLHGHGLHGFIQCFAEQINAYEGFEPYQPRVKDMQYVNPPQHREILLLLAEY